MSVFQLPEEMAKYPGEWIALSSDLKSVAGHGVNGMEAMAMAEKAGEPNGVLVFMPAQWPDAIVV